MIEKKVVKNLKIFSLALALILIVLPFVSAGVGISWDKETSLIPENTKTCLTYKVYNPWPEDSTVEIALSDNLMEIVSYIQSESVFVPKDTSSKNAIPIEFCFKTPNVYEKDCFLFNKLLCKQDCIENMRIYEGEVEVLEVGDQVKGSGAGGSATAVSVSAPLRVKVQCVAHTRNYSLIYILIAVAAGIFLIINLIQRRKKKDKSKVRK